MKLLIIMPSWIGDAVMSQPLLRRLRERHPSAIIDAVATPWSAPVVSRMTEVSHIIDSPLRHGRLNWKAIRILAKTLAGKHYDEAIILPNSFKSALLPWLAGIPVRRGFLGEFRWGLLNRICRPDPKRRGLLINRYLMLADDHVYPSAANDGFLPPALRSTSSDQMAVLKAFGLTDGRPITVFCPGAEYGPAKQWPPHHFATLAQSLAAQKIRICLLGSEKDRAIGVQIQEMAALKEDNCINLCGHTTLEQAIDLLAVSFGVVSNDSGLMHVAAAVGAKVVALYGSSDPCYTPPLAEKAVILRQPQPCSPCFQRQCRFGHYQCLESISPDHVLSTLLTPSYNL